MAAAEPAPPVLHVTGSAPRSWRQRFWQPAVFIAIGLLLPYFHDLVGTAWFPLTTLTYCAIWILFALGLNIVVGYAGLLDLGYVAFFLIGAYTAGWMMSSFFYQFKSPGVHVFDAGLVGEAGLHVSFWIVVPCAALLAAILGVLIGAPTLRLKSDYLALVTLGFGEILPQAFRNGDNIHGFNLTSGTVGIGPLDPLDLKWLSWTGVVPDSINTFDYRSRYYVMFALCLLFIVVSLRLRDGRLGRAWLAIREDELAASLMGVPLMRTKLWAYAIGAAAGGVGGAFYAVSLGGISVDTFTFQFSIQVLCMVIVGGIANVYGVALGALVLTWLNFTGLVQVGAEFNHLAGTSIDITRYTFGIYGAALVLMMLFRREGILPAARVRKAQLLDEEVEQKTLVKAPA